jgi:hypothetical protein
MTTRLIVFARTYEGAFAKAAAELGLSLPELQAMNPQKFGYDDVGTADATAAGQSTGMPVAGDLQPGVFIIVSSSE